MNINEISSTIIGAAIEVHKTIGPGLLESAYEACLCRELQLREVKFSTQVSIPLVYKEKKLDCGYRLDMLVEDLIVVELKSCDRIEAIHKAQILTYLKLLGRNLGLILNFNVPMMKDGVQRIVHELKE